MSRFVKKIIAVIVLIVITLCVTSCSSKAVDNRIVVDEKLVIKNELTDSADVELNRISDNIWLHTSYIDYNGTRTPSNGLVISTSEGLVLIDTPWNDFQTKELIELTKKQFQQTFVQAIITHAHSDRIGGINELKKNKIEVRSTSMTSKIAECLGYQKPNSTLDNNPSINFGNLNIEVYYPGAGHSQDNIVVWIPEEKLLFGGCLIKSLEAKNIGEAKEADIKQWVLSVTKVLEKYGDAEIVIPGHGQWGDIELVEHTLELLSLKVRL